MGNKHTNEYLKMIRIDCMVPQDQYDKLHEMSYKGKKKDKKETELTFSEHFRKALDDYIEKESEEK